MISIRTSILGMAVVIAGGCRYNPPVVPLEARAAEVERLAGRWTGAYTGENSGRSGTIEFILVAGEDHAHGDVVMIPLGSDRPYRSWRDPGPGARVTAAVEELTIRFVAVENGEISGELDPYRDPDCDCRAITRFRGAMGGDAIVGSFVTYRAGPAGPARGTWKVSRQRS